MSLGALRAQAAVPPPRRDLAEVKAVLARAPQPPTGNLRPLTVLLIANRKDHGTHEHDYPRWMERWKVLLGGKTAGASPTTMFGLTSNLPASPKPGAARVKVETAVDWPTADQFQRADLVVACMGTGGIWNEAKLRDLRAVLDRGAGFVALHAAVIAEKPHAQPLADLLGLAWEGGYTLFRHGALDLKITAKDHPITRGLPDRLQFEDESYWPLVGDPKRVTTLATQDEAERGTGRSAPFPMFWTHTVGKGRVFSSILGHYDWTYDDPYFRILVLRGMAWAAGESPYRFDPIVLSGARTTDQKQAVAAAPKAPVVAPVAPDANDPNLLLWLDAADAASVAAGPDGRVSGWSNKAARAGGKLVSDGVRQPQYVSNALGGRPTVRFDGVDDVLRNTAFRQASGEWTIAMVVTPRSNQGLFRALLAANRPRQDDFQTGFNLDLGPGETATFNSLNLEGIKAGGAANLRNSSSPFGSGHVLILTTGAGRSGLWVDGQDEEGRGAGEAITAMEELRLGGRFYMGQERGFFHGDVSEVLIYRTQLNEAQRAGLGAHLLAKYGPDIQPPSPVVMDPWDYLPTFEWDGTRRPLTAIDEAVARARTNARDRKALEVRLLEIATDASNPVAARDYACRRLAIIGTPAGVPALAKLLEDPALSTIACFALERIPGREADQALLAALPRVAPKQRVEVIHALGTRQSRAAVPAVGPLLQYADAPVRAAAITALGDIGGPAAVAALSAALEQQPPTERSALASALLKCGDRYAAEGRKADAEAVFSRLRKPGMPDPARRAATRALILRGGADAASLLVEQLNSSDTQDRATALLLIRGTDAASLITARLGSLPPEAQARVITVLADRGQPAAAASIRAAAKQEQPQVRLAAVEALGRVGDASDVPLLLAAATGSDKALTAAARVSLARLSGPGVDAALQRSLEQGSLETRGAAIEALGRRGVASAIPALLRAARGTETALREAAIRALGEAATVADVPALVKILAEPQAPRDAQAAETAIAAIFARTEEKDRWADALLAGLPGASVETRGALLRSLSLQGGPKALQAVNAAISDADPDLRDEALGLLSAWESPEAAELLLNVVKKPANPTHRSLALRGYVRLAGLPQLPPARRLAMSQEALRLAERDDERRLVLATLAGVPTLEALRTALPYLEREGLSEEAAAAVVAIAPGLLPDQDAVVIEALDRVRKHVKNEELLRQAAELRRRAAQAVR
jgi:HEAT repeat protein/type 1 glutamine amidotransferase